MATRAKVLTRKTLERRSTLYSELDFQRRQRIDPRVGSPPEHFRSDFRRDFARLLHSASFRRLQGKTQLFPGSESDFFRNRLTHSLEVAQIAKSIALKINCSEPYASSPIDLDLVEFSALAHDLGHPPFGHNGEFALNVHMIDDGGFEGNAQTFRILSRIEKKEKVQNAIDPIDDAGIDLRLGLNVTARSLASIVKYPRLIKYDSDHTFQKGLYDDDWPTFRNIAKKLKFPLSSEDEKFQFQRTIECSIMDVADDIAYSTYDLEDTLKAGFHKPLDIVFCSDGIISRVREKVYVSTGKLLTEAQIRSTLALPFPGVTLSGAAATPLIAEAVQDAYGYSEKVSSDGYARTETTSSMVNLAIDAIIVEINDADIRFSQVFLAEEARVLVECFKHFNYEANIASSRVRVPEYRGQQIVSDIFKALNESENGTLLLPHDQKRLYDRSTKDPQKKRIISDFIAGMTDRYAVEFHQRLFSEGAESIFKPI